MERSLEHLIQAVERVEHAVGSLETSISHIREQSKVNRRLAGGLALVMLLMIVNVFYFRKSSCEDGNDANFKQKQLWAGIIALSSNDTAKKPDPVVLKTFNDLLTQAYPIRDCSSVYWQL